MTSYNALWVEETENGFKQSIISKPLSSLPKNDILIRVHYSSLNFKDAMSFHGNKAITKVYPHQPGIDAAGIIEHSNTHEFKKGDEVIVTGYDLGMNTFGGLAEFIAVPSQWVIRKPQNLSLLEAMQWGTAGLTAALCIDKLTSMGVKPSNGDVLVTGATGGVGSLAITLLASQGFSVIACTGKQEQHNKLKSIGASSVIPRSEALQQGKSPLLKAKFSAAIDVTGGDMLASILKQIHHGGSVACCGLVSSPKLETTVLPFILRGINLLGVDSVEITQEKKQVMWEMLANTQTKDALQIINQCITLDECPSYLRKIFNGESEGHVLVTMNKK